MIDIDYPHKECIIETCREACERVRVEGPSTPHFPRSDGQAKKGGYAYHLFPSDYHPSGLCYYHLVKSEGWFDAEFPLHKHFQEERPFYKLGKRIAGGASRRSFWEPLNK